MPSPGDEPSEQARKTGSQSQRRSRWRIVLLVLAALLLVVRVAAPYVLRPVLEDQVSALLAGRVEVGDVDLRLLTGGAALQEVAFYAEDNDEAVLAWADLDVTLRYLPLAQRSVTLQSVRLDAPSLHLARNAAGALNLLELFTPPPDPEEVPAPETPEEEAGEPWEVRVEEIALNGVSLSYSEAANLDPRRVELSFDAAARDFSLSGDEESLFDLDLTTGGGRVRAKGGFDMEPLALRVDLDWEELALPELVLAVPDERATWLREGRTSGKLAILAGAPEEGALRASGELQVPALRIEAAEGGRPSLAWTQLAVAIEEIVVPGLFGASEPEESDAAAPATDPVLVSLSSLRLVEPDVNLGLVQAGLEGISDAPTSDEEDASESEEAAESEDEAAPGVELALASLEIETARIAVHDATAEPPFDGELSGLDLKARDLRWPGPQARGLDLEGSLLGSGALGVKGDVAPGDTALDLKVANLPLEPLSAYAERYIGYGLTGGAFSLDSQAKLKGESFDTKNKLVLDALAVSSGGDDSATQALIGVPLPVALALLRDASGKIQLSLPVKGGVTGAGAGFAAALTAVLKQTLVGALSSPLKAAGAAVQVASGEKQSLGPSPVSFEPGRDRLSEEADAQLEGLARFLGSQDGLSVKLEGIVTESDLGADAKLSEPEHAGALATRRAEKVKSELLESHGVDPRQVENSPDVAAPPPAKPQEGPPRVEVRLGLAD